MKTAWIISMAMAAGLSLPVSGCAPNSEPTVFVYLQNDKVVQLRQLQRAESVAAEIFSGIGVRLEFRIGAPRKSRKSAKCPGQLAEAIEVRFDGETPSGSQEGELARAALYKTSGIRIQVFYNRVVAHGGTRDITGVLLGHVLAHEITHVLGNVPGHSPSGLMKAHWERADLDEMALRTMPLDDVDINRIRAHFAQLAAAFSGMTAATRNTVAHSMEAE